MSTNLERAVLGTVAVLVLIVATGAVHAASATAPETAPETAIVLHLDGSNGDRLH